MQWNSFSKAITDSFYLYNVIFLFLTIIFRNYSCLKFDFVSSSVMGLPLMFQGWYAHTLLSSFLSNTF